MHYFVSAGLLSPKKLDSATNRLNRYLNYPLVGLASKAARGVSGVIVIHGGYNSPEFTLESYSISSHDSLHMSLPSVYCLPWAQKYLTLLRESGYRHEVTCGGRWVIDGREAWVRNMLSDPYLRLVPGFGEGYIEERFGCWQGVVSHDYTLMPDYREYHPSIEVSRGCGRGCSFCVERFAPRQVMLSGAATADRMNHVRLMYAPTEIRPYVEASLFLPSDSWVASFAKRYRALDLKTRWRTETRVDALKPDSVATLAEHGLAVIDLGLESASPRQLAAMGKCTEPNRYLERASATLRACRTAGVRAKVNVVLYPGEDYTSYGQTLNWLKDNRENVGGISAGPLVYYPMGMGDYALPRDLTDLGAALVDQDQPMRSGFGDLHLSRAIDNETARALCLDLSKEFMTARDYFEIKSFGYFSPSLTLEDFSATCAKDDPDTLPFSPDPPTVIRGGVSRPF